MSESLFFFQEYAIRSSGTNELTLINLSPSTVTPKNNKLNVIPSKENIKRFVFELNEDSPIRPDCFTCHFLQHCWIL